MRNSRYDPNVRYSLPSPLADTFRKRRLLRPLSRRSVREQRTGSLMQRRGSLSFRVHGVHCQGTTDADTALVGSNYERMHGIDRDRHGRSPARAHAVQWKSGPSRHGNAPASVQLNVRTGSTWRTRRESSGVSAWCEPVARRFALHGTAV